MPHSCISSTRDRIVPIAHATQRTHRVHSAGDNDAAWDLFGGAFAGGETTAF